MNILITAATKFELNPLIAKLFGDVNGLEYLEKIPYRKLNIDFLFSGIGLVHTAYKLTKILCRSNYDLVINAGIAGSFNRKLAIGDVVIVEQEEFGDLGIEAEDGFSTLFDSGFMKMNEFPFVNGKLPCHVPSGLSSINLPLVSGLSCNTAHGKQENVDQLTQKFKADIETMEGAAFAFVCLLEKVHFLQIRAISNYVESRDPSKWNVSLALDNLSKEIMRVLNVL